MIRPNKICPSSFFNKAVVLERVCGCETYEEWQQLHGTPNFSADLPLSAGYSSNSVVIRTMSSDISSKMIDIYGCQMLTILYRILVDQNLEIKFIVIASNFLKQNSL